MDSLPGNAPFVLSAMTPALLVDTCPTLNLAGYQRARLPIICQHLLCDARAHAVVCRALSRFSRDESRYSNHVSHGLLACFLYAAHSLEGPPHPTPVSTSWTVRHSRKCSTSFSNKASSPRDRRHYPSVLLPFWASEVAQSPPPTEHHP